MPTLHSHTRCQAPQANVATKFCKRAFQLVSTKHTADRTLKLPEIAMTVNSEL